MQVNDPVKRLCHNVSREIFIHFTHHQIFKPYRTIAFNAWAKEHKYDHIHNTDMEICMLMSQVLKEG